MSEWKDVEWELVTDFGSLRAGDYCAYLDCRWCGGKRHEFILLRYDPARELLLPPARPWIGPAWHHTDACPSMSPRRQWLTLLAVERRVVYRAVIPPPAVAVERKKELSR